jgi:hypothetical protein
MHILWLHIYMAWLFLYFLPEPLCPIATPSPFPLYSLSLTWRPPAVTGTVLPLIRLLVDWPHLPLLSPNQPTHSASLEPQQLNAWHRRHWGHSASTMRNNTYTYLSRISEECVILYYNNADILLLPCSELRFPSPTLMLPVRTYSAYILLHKFQIKLGWNWGISAISPSSLLLSYCKLYKIHNMSSRATPKKTVVKDCRRTDTLHRKRGLLDIPIP